MLTVRRLNLDSSWHLSWGGQQFVIDPWLIGSEVDGFRWLNEQWHATPPLPLSEIPPCDAIVVTQSYSDHCHLPTLREMDPGIPLLATGKAFVRLRKHFPEREVLRIPDMHNRPPLVFGDLHFRALHPGRRRDPVYYGLVISNVQREAVALTPHGFRLDVNQLDQMVGYRCRLLLTSFAQYELPALLGGKVNPGLENVRQLLAQLQPERVLSTHDEQKPGRGLVPRLARTRYPDLSQVAEAMDFPLDVVEDYEPRSWP